ncbi:MAG: response regulator [Burkholderiales bacterium]|nr:response regulator [Burkholderiales bacterium]
MSAPLVPILLVDDRRENLVALAALLETRSDLDIVLANSGEEALRQLLIRDFGLVLLDVQMPDMDGFEAATLIRANPKTRQVPIIFVTALMHDADFEFRGYESGAVDYLVKPLEPFILHAKVEVFVNLYRQRLALAEHERYMAHVEQLVVERTGHRPNHDNKLRVLLVDDRPENLIALEAMLMEMDDVLLVKANSGSEALRAVLRYDFAVILMDVQMPGMDGFETAELIRSNPKTHLIPIIFVTAGMKTINSVTQGYRQGAVDYLIKPLEPAIVKSKVKVFCDLYKHRLSIEKHSTYLEILVADRTSALQNSATELTENNERYRRLVEKLELATRAAGLGIWDWNVVSNELVWDTRMMELYGYSADSFGGSYRDWISRLHPDDRVRCDVAVQNALYQGQPYDTDFRICLPDGRICDIKADGKVVFDELGQPLRMTGINYDVTERKRAAEEVRLHRDHLLELVDERTASLKAIVDHAADGIITIDRVGTVLSFNTAAERMFAYPANTVIGNNISILMPTSVAKEHNAYIQHYLKTGEAHIIGSGRELQGRRSDGSIFPLYLAVSETKVGEQLRFTGIARDISSQKAMEANLIQAREVAEAANLAKSVFLSNMSHELRTPLNAVIGFSRLMSREESLNEHQRQNLEIINHAGNHLLTLINDVLELSKIEAGRTQLTEESTDLPRLLQEVGAMLRGRAEQVHLGLHLDMSGLPSTVRVDAIKLRQVLINLLGNAIKFTQQG